MEEKKRYNLGVLIGGVHTYFPKEHIKGISEAASELDVNVCFFLGTRTKDFFEDVLGSKQKNSYDYQFNTIHDYSLIGGLDGLIINYGTLGIQLREDDPNKFAQKYNGITTVFLTEVVDVPNCHSLLCDNKGGIAMVISHLVEEHHLSRILFMAGPEHNTDAIERKEAYLETMKKYGLPVTHGMIAQGTIPSLWTNRWNAFWIATRMPRPLYLPMMRWLLPAIVSARSVGLWLARIL